MIRFTDALTPENLSPDKVQATFQSALQVTDDYFERFQALHLSLPQLVGGVLICLLVLVFAAREAASWFFKVDSMRREIRRVQATATQLEGEVRQMRELLVELQGPLQDCLAEKNRASSTTAPTEPEPESNSDTPDDPDSNSDSRGASATEARQFPITH